MKVKSRTALQAVLSFVFSFSVLGSLYLYFQRSPLDGALSREVLSNSFPEKPNDDLILPFGHTLGPWPQEFKGEPIVTRLAYLKGPPRKFLDSMTQVWRPVEAEVVITGPKTVLREFKIQDWRKCFQSEFTCITEKRAFWARVFPERGSHEEDEVRADWFESMDPKGARGVHLIVKSKTYQIDRFAIITENGVVQTFSLKSVLNPIGLDARELFFKTLGGLKVREDLQNAKAWIETRIKGVNLEEIKRIPDLKERFKRLILVQNWIYSYLSVDPASAPSYFHLAGVTHRIAMDLLKTKEPLFENQESWILSFEPLLTTLIRYLQDFPGQETLVKNMEALLADFLVERDRLLGRH